ncbi:MAG: cell division protein FtsA [Candidatus Parcubacteria bacterium]|nr:cell division protein FtsA [Candidatus Parcubacteria bacterium]
MPKPKIISAIDIGTSSIKGLTVIKDANTLEILSKVNMASFGIRKGVVVNIDEVSQRISKVIAQMEDESGEKINEIITNINGSHIFSIPSRGTVVVSRADERISAEDIDRVMQAAQAFPLTSNKEILDIFPREFIVDGEGGVREPEGMRGRRLEVEILALCTFSPYFKNCTNAVLNSDLKISDIIPSPLAAARAVLTSQQKELGSCVIDIGAGTTGFAAYEEGNLVYAAVLPVGSAHITNDIAVFLKTNIETAEKIKREYGTCILSNSKGRKDIRVDVQGEENPIVFSQKDLTGIINDRISEIFGEVSKILKKITPNYVFPGGVVITGGGAKLPKIPEFAKNELKLPCRLGVCEELKGYDGDHSFSTSAGLILMALDEHNVKEEPKIENVFSKLKKIFKEFIP